MPLRGGNPLKLLLGREPTEGGLKFEEEMVSNLEKYEEELEREQSGDAEL
ncbi:hypothetical protein [Thermogymnomonas acidicola]|nr:hypothetical protein [Thermogymnomonas acidicola]